MPEATDSGKRKSIVPSTETIAKSPILSVVAAILSVFLVFRTAVLRVGWGQLPVPLLIAVIWSLFLWAILYFTPYIKKLTRKEAGLAGAVLTLVTMLWMLFPSSLIASCVAWILFVVVTMSRPSWQSWVNRIGAAWLCSALIIVVIWSGAISLLAISNTPNKTVPTTATGDSLPDIYFVVPDRFTSVDGLREFGDDPAEFVDRLKKQGFYVRENSMSSDQLTPGVEDTDTTRTLRFMASIFNDGETIDMDIGYNKAIRMVRESSTIQGLKALGYEYHNIGSWFPETRNSPLADYSYSYKGYDLASLVYSSELSTAVINMSLLQDADIGRLFTLSGGAETRRNEHLYQKNTVLDIASTRTEHPKFVFVHLILPHPPYVWSADGSAMPTGLTEKEQYLQQLDFTKIFLLDIVDGLGEGIVIIQSDEGVLFADPADNAGLTETQWNGVLTAWRIPGVEVEELDSISHTQVLGFVKNLIGQK